MAMLSQRNQKPLKNYHTPIEKKKDLNVVVDDALNIPNPMNSAIVNTSVSGKTTVGL